MRIGLALLLVGILAALALPVQAQFGKSALSPEGVITQAERAEEIAIKMERLTEWLAAEGYGAVLINQYCNFQWITAGSDMQVVTAAQRGPVTLVITAEGERYAVCANDEAVRMRDEELGDIGYEIVEYEWFEDKPGHTGAAEALQGVIGDLGKVASDFDTPVAENRAADIAKLRASLTEPEMKKLRWLGRECSEACEVVCRTMDKGMTEKEVQAMIAGELMGREIQPTVLLIASDERLFHYRHAIATDETCDEYVQVNICAKKWGLIIAVTRYVYFGEVPDELQEKLEDCATVCGAYLEATVPGATAGEILAAGIETMGECGWPEEWRLHHQGGAIGYEERDWVAYPGATMEVVPNQAFAWNPTIQGAKVEDTIILHEDGTLENVTDTGAWPTIEVKVGDQVYNAPAILER